MNETPSPSDPGSKLEEPEARPVGAILVTTFLALMILISWFGVYFLEFLRR